MNLFNIRPLQPNIGALIEGIDLSRPLTADLGSALSTALHRYRVLFFRDQDLSPEQHIELGRSFGELEVHPVLTRPEYPEIVPLIFKTGDRDTRREVDRDWHADTTFRLNPSSASILRAVLTPTIGGDTVFSNVVAAYKALDDSLRARIDRLTAIHDAALFASLVDGKEGQAAMRRDHPPVEHPVVAIHPVTGEKTLFVNPTFTKEIVGLEEQESRELLGRLFDQVKRPEFQVRWSWRPGSIAFWDNRATQHYAVTDYDEPRHMERVTIAGDRPRGVAKAPAAAP